MPSFDVLRTLNLVWLEESGRASTGVIERRMVIVVLPLLFVGLRT